MKKRTVSKDAQKRPCAYVKCKIFYSPTAENQKFHLDQCRILAFYLRKIEGWGEEQKQWEAEIRKIVARQEIEA